MAPVVYKNHKWMYLALFILSLPALFIVIPLIISDVQAGDMSRVFGLGFFVLVMLALDIWFLYELTKGFRRLEIVGGALRVVYRDRVDEFGMNDISELKLVEQNTPTGNGYRVKTYDLSFKDPSGEIKSFQLMYNKQGIMFANAVKAFIK